MCRAIQRMLMIAALAAPLAAQQPAPVPPPTEAPPATPARPAKPPIDAETRKQIEKARREAARARVEARKASQEFQRIHSGAYLGVDIRDVTSDRVAALKLREERGVEVTMVDQDAPAGKAGLKEHDVIVSFNGTNIEGVEQLRRMIRETPAGRNVALGISREGKPMTMNVQLAARKQYAMALRPGKPMKFEMPDVVIPAMPPMDFDMPQFSMLQFSSRNG